MHQVRHTGPGQNVDQFVIGRVRVLSNINAIGIATNINVFDSIVGRVHRYGSSAARHGCRQAVDSARTCRTFDLRARGCVRAIDIRIWTRIVGIPVASGSNQQSGRPGTNDIGDTDIVDQAQLLSVVVLNSDCGKTGSIERKVPTHTYIVFVAPDVFE